MPLVEGGRGQFYQKIARIRTTSGNLWRFSCIVSQLALSYPFQHEYAVRSGIESTHEQAIRRCGLRRSRYVGLAKTHLQHLLTSIAINLVRLSDWWAGISPAKTRCSPFAALQWGTPAVHHI
jgi:Transposase DDE domain